MASAHSLAYQDLANLLAQQSGLTERARTLLISNPFAALRPPTFSLPKPAGVAIPQLPLPDHFGTLKGVVPHIAPAVLEEEPDEPEVLIVNQATKTDRLVPSKARVTETVETRPATDSLMDEFAISTELAVTDVESVPARADYAGTLARSIDPVPPAGTLGQLSRLFFGANEIELPPLAFEHRNPAPKLQLAALPNASLEDGTTVAPKGEVTGEEGQPKSPAEQLGLTSAARAKAEKCLAQAVYFESRSEPERGQIAVAQVVINRVFSGYYPEDVCRTVFQNAHRHLACQFTFACEGKKLTVNDKASWALAERIARDMLDGKLWLNEIGKATHYHAYYVRPRWVRGMRRIQRIGAHTFYRPRAWTEG